MFDAESFLNSTMTGELATEFELPPEGTYRATVTKVDARTVETKDGDRVILSVVWRINDDRLAEELGREPAVRQDIWLDFDETGALDRGKSRNVDLGRLRQALGQNDSKRKWAPAMLVDGVAMIQVTHRSDPKDPEKKYPNVRRVTAVS